jgi:putative glutamine amidotransferase
MNILPKSFILPDMIQKPLIGIVLDLEEKGDYSIYPYYVLRQDYFTAITKAGGIPVGVSLATGNVEDYVVQLDGLLLPGGDYDIPPHVYGDDSIHETVVMKKGRLDFDVMLTRQFLEKNKPILGICLGEQLLAVLHGGSLIQDIAHELPHAVEHYVEDRLKPAHRIDIKEGTLLHRILGETSMEVNSHHHQAVREEVPGFVVNARSVDGVIEAIEVPGKKFCLGMQWHPEHFTVEKEIEIFRAFVNACKE